MCDPAIEKMLDEMDCRRMGKELAHDRFISAKVDEDEENYD